MARPTKEEAQRWRDHLASLWAAHESLEREDYDALMAWLWRVRAALPSAAAVQRDRVRRKKVDPETCPGCGCSPSECACPSGQYE